MKRTTKNSIIAERYSSPQEFLVTVTGRQDNESWAGGTVRQKAARSRERGDEDQLARAKYELINGNEKLYHTIKAAEAPRRLDTEPGRRVQYFNAPVGYTPNVPNAIMGLPDSMINMRIEPKKTKILDVLYSPECSWNTKPGKLAKFGNAVLNEIVRLEKAGYRVRLSLMFGFAEERGKAHILTIPLKSERQPMDIRRMAFPMISDQMLRQIVFEWYETLPGAERILGYGLPMNALSRRRREELTQSVITPGAQPILICYDEKGFNPEKAFASLKPKGGERA